jgi:16S rRNA processing protein RimM
MPAEQAEQMAETHPDDEPRETLRLVVGRVGKAHGLRGEVTVEVHTDDPEFRFAPGAVLEADPARRGPLTVATGRVQGSRLVLRFEGVEDRTGAEALRNTLLIVEADPDELPDDPDEFYDHQLVGLSVRTVDGREIGTVAEMLHLPTQDVFAVKRADGREVLIPFVEEIVPEVDLDERTVLVDPPPGLLELADPPAAADPSPAADS